MGLGALWCRLWGFPGGRSLKTAVTSDRHPDTAPRTLAPGLGVQLRCPCSYQPQAAGVHIWARDPCRGRTLGLFCQLLRVLGQASRQLGLSFLICEARMLVPAWVALSGRKARLEGGALSDAGIGASGNPSFLCFSASDAE